jgi:hypothetical protein
MLSDTDLARGEIVKPDKHLVHPKKKAVAPKTRTRLSWRTRLFLLLAANAILWVVIYYLLSDENKKEIWRLAMSSRLQVTGIIYNAERPSAIIGGKVVYEGDVIKGCKVVKINKETVDLEKKGKRFTRKVY